MSLATMVMELLAFVGLGGPFDLDHIELQKRSVVVIAVPDCLRRTPFPLMNLSPTGTLEDCFCHRIDYRRVGGLMKENRDGSPTVIELVLDNEEATSPETLSEAVRKLQEGADDPLAEWTHGPANAIVFVYLHKLDPLASWYQFMSLFPGPLSRLPGLVDGSTSNGPFGVFLLATWPPALLTASHVLNLFSAGFPMGGTMRTRLWIGATALAAAVLAGGWLMADDPKKPDEPKAHGFLPRDFKKLGLTDKQTQEIYKIEGNYKDKIAALQQQIDDLKAAERKEIDGVLTGDQKARLKELLLGEPADKDKPAPDKEKPTPTTDKDKPAPPKDK